MRVPEAFDYLRPTASKLRGLIIVSEEQNRWVKGRFDRDPSAMIELSFELAMETPGMLGTNVTYMGVWRQRRTLIEYQMGVLVVRPDDATWHDLIKPLITRLGTYYPPAVTRDTIFAAINSKKG